MVVRETNFDMLAVDFHRQISCFGFFTVERHIVCAIVVVFHITRIAIKFRAYFGIVLFFVLFLVGI